jgi:hypothetical protein
MAGLPATAQAIATHQAMVGSHASQGFIEVFRIRCRRFSLASNSYLTLPVYILI